MLSTHTRSSRVAICASELMPTKYLNWLLVCLYMSLSSGLSRFGFSRWRADPCCDLGSATAAHPRIRLPCVLDDLTDVGIESEQPVRQAERIACISQRGHPSHEVRPSAAEHHVKRR